MDDRLKECPRCGRKDLTAYVSVKAGVETTTGYRCQECGPVKPGDKRESVTTILQALSTTPEYTTTSAYGFGEVLDFESRIVAGMKVQARWTNCGNFYREEAEIVRVNRASFRVRILAGYLAGRCIAIPRVSADTWSNNNAVFPVASVVA